MSARVSIGRMSGAVLAVVLAAGCGRTVRIQSAETPAMSKEGPMIVLTNGSYEVGIAPRLGGRVVVFKRVGGDNVLHASPACWTDTEAEIPPCEPTADFKAYNGHIIWVGPQGDWWVQQDVNPRRRDRRADWPPDPFLVFGRYETAAITPDSVRLVGPPSPVCGLQLTKDVRLDGDHVRLRVEAKNIRATPVTWDLWSNTRLSGAAACYVPVTTSTVIRLTHLATGAGTTNVLPYRVADGFFTFTVQDALPRGVCGQVAKAFISKPHEGVIAGFSGGNCFIKRFEAPPPARIHKDQAVIEIYQNHNRNPDARLLELEAHGEYRTLQPGETMVFEETWQLVPYRGAARAASHTKFLRRLGLGAPSP